MFWERENIVWITSIIYFCTRMIIYLFCQIKKGQSLFVNAVTLVKKKKRNRCKALHFFFFFGLAWLGWPKGSLHFNKLGPMWFKHHHTIGQEVFKWSFKVLNGYSLFLTLVHFYHIYVVYALCIFYCMNLFLHVLYTGKTTSTWLKETFSNCLM